MAVGLLAVYSLPLLTSGCASYSAREVTPTGIQIANYEIPEDELLDVGVVVFSSPEMSEEEAQEKGTHPRVRQSERHFIPSQVRNTLQQSGQWGAVRVLPEAGQAHDVIVEGEILESNGQTLVLRVTVTDATGREWFQQAYEIEATGENYRDNIPWQKDAFQDLYNTISNDMAAYRELLTPEQVLEIRRVAELKFARDFAPEAYDEYLAENDDGELRPKRLPAGNDPMMQRLLTIREREYMFVDTLNQYYDGFYASMWPAYENWRKLDLTERLARAEVKRSAWLRQVGGVLLIAAAIAMEVAAGGNSSNILTGLLVVGGGQVFLDGLNISKQAEMHSAAIQELSESFGADMEPIVLDLQGQTHELSGTAQEQYHQWRKLLKEIYLRETGIVPPDVAPAPAPGA
ncbi:MAG: hypothetical protein PVJ53_16040 [Desulfobacterales bacterium]